MKFLDHPPRYFFFTGKGGVGKTSTACASAIRLAEAGKKVLLVSTDPASNVAQVFGFEIGNRITPIPELPNLSALEIDPQAAAQAYRDRIVSPVRGLLPEGVVRGIEEQLSGACTTEIAAFDEFTALLTDNLTVTNFEHIIFDTAPTGHTIRLLQLPAAWSGFLDTTTGDTSCLGPLAGLDKQREQYKAAVDALSDSHRTRLVLVSRAQNGAIREVTRTHHELADIGLTQQYLVINGVLPAEEAGTDELAAAIHHREQRVLANLPEALKARPCDLIALKPFNLVGMPRLRQLFEDIALPTTLATHDRQSNLNAPTLSQLVDGIAADGHGLVMMMGKGGVGKTTMAAAVAVELANRGLPVHLTTSDPAAHLAETLSGTLDNLTLSRIDPHVEIERYRAHILETKGRQLDESGLAMLKEELLSPCTEEIAVFQAFSRVIREAGKVFVVMDTAPTGHTLLLLEATAGYHREVSRQVESLDPDFTTPMMLLQDPGQTKVLLVTLAETTPVLEAVNLQNDLRRAGIEPWAWVINSSIAAAETSSPLLQHRAMSESREIDNIANHYASRYAVVPILKQEPVGLEQLLQLASAQQITGRLVKAA